MGGGRAGGPGGIRGCIIRSEGDGAAERAHPVHSDLHSRVGGSAPSQTHSRSGKHTRLPLSFLPPPPPPSAEHPPPWQLQAAPAPCPAPFPPWSRLRTSPSRTTPLSSVCLSRIPPSSGTAPLTPRSARCVWRPRQEESTRLYLISTADPRSPHLDVSRPLRPLSHGLPPPRCQNRRLCAH